MKSDGPSPITVGSARPEEWDQAFQLVFQHSGSADWAKRVANALEMARKGEFDPAGIVVARQGAQLVGAMLCLPVPGASGLVWPPQTLAHPQRQLTEDKLVQFACAVLQDRQARLAQALLPPAETAYGIPLERNGFDRVTDLWYMRRYLRDSLPHQPRQNRLRYQTYGITDRALFHKTLLQTYEKTLDCPEVNGLRTIDEIISGHQAQGAFNPEHWWLAFAGERAVGVLLVTDVPEWQAWDVAYVGVLPEFRRRGFGWELMGKVLQTAAEDEVEQLTLSVDVRNRPAWNLYRSLGFEPFDQRAVFLAVWKG